MQEVAAHQLDVRGVVKRFAEPGEQLVVKLDGDEVAAALGQLTGKDSPPRTDLDYEVPAGNGGLSDETSRESPAPQEVLRELSAPPRPVSLTGHGRTLHT